MEKQDSLKLRKKIKAKKPKFVGQDTHKRKRIRPRWKRPKGMQSKMRLHRRGYRKSVTPGYGSPKIVKGLDASGLKIVNINSLKELEGIDKASQGIIISGSLGNKKRVEIIKKAKETGIKILNIKDTDVYVKNIEDKFKKKKEEKAKKVKKKEEKKKKAEKEKPKEEKGELAEKVSEEEKKEAEKKERDKLLTKKELQ